MSFLSILDFGHVPEPTLHLGLGQPQRTSLLHLQDSMVNTGALAVLLKDSHPQAILKPRPPKSLDYSTH